MAPSRTDPTSPSSDDGENTYDLNVPYRIFSEDYKRHVEGRTEFPAYLPVWEEGVWFDDFPIFDYEDPALRADKKKPHLFKAGVTGQLITPRMGTILTGVKLEELSSEAKDELALLICERKVVVLREQLGFLRAGPQFQVEFMSYFGKLSNQPVTGAIKGFPQFHVIHRDSNEEQIKKFFETKMTSKSNVFGSIIFLFLEGLSEVVKQYLGSFTFLSLNVFRAFSSNFP